MVECSVCHCITVEEREFSLRIKVGKHNLSYTVIKYECPLCGNRWSKKVS